MRRIACVFLIILLLVACDTYVSTSGSSESNARFYRITEQPECCGVYRFYDVDAGVVLWVYVGYNKGGITSQPVGLTRLSGK